MISDKERAIIESAAAEINPDEVPGKDFLDELITAAKGGQAPGAIIKAFMFFKELIEILQHFLFFRSHACEVCWFAIICFRFP